MNNSSFIYFNRKKTKNFSNKGFTIIELLVVVAIIGLLSSIIYASLKTAQNKSANTAVKVNLNNIRTQMNLSYISNYDSYLGLCASDPLILRMLADAKKNGDGVTPAVCYDNSSKWAATAKLRVAEGTYTYWCTDSTNASKGETQPISAGVVVCP